jgi:hypothetical protein
MMIPILLMLATLQPQQQTEQQAQRQQIQLEQLRQELQQQREQLGRLLQIIERQSQKQDQEAPLCSAEIRRVNETEQRKVPLNSAAITPLNLFSVVTKPPDACLQAEIRVTASYLDAKDNLICSGVVENVAEQNNLTQSINLEIRPWNLREFVRWRNEPLGTNSGARRLVCVNADGSTEATSEELERTALVRVRATVLPRGGGMSTTEIQLSPQR